jgi:hypothetical protein
MLSCSMAAGSVNSKWTGESFLLSAGSGLLDAVIFQSPSWNDAGGNTAAHKDFTFAGGEPQVRLCGSLHEPHSLASGSKMDQQV